MADITKTVEIVFGGSDSNLSATMSSISKNFDSFDASVTKISQPFADAAESILKLDAVLAALVVGGMVSAVKESMKMDEALDAVGTTVNLTSGQMGEFKEQIKNYASGSTQSIDSITASISSAIKKGNDWNSSIDITRQAEILAVATRSDLKSATDILTETINAYGLNASDAARLTDVFTVAVQQGAGSLPDLASSLGKVGGIASTAGISIEEILAAVATLGSKGIDAGTAMAGLTRTISNMLEPSSKTAAAAKELGLDWSYASLQTKGFVGVLEEAYVATGGNAEKLKELFGSVKGLNVAVSLAKDSHDKFTTSMNALKDSAGVASTVFKEESQDLDKIFQTLTNNFTTLLSDIGDRLTPTVSAITGGITGIFKGLREGIDAGTFAPLFDYIAEIGKQLADKLAVIAKNLPEAMKGLDFSGLISSLGGLGTALKSAFQLMFGEIDLTTVEGLHAAIQRVIEGFKGLIDVTKGIIDGMKPLFVSIGELIKGWESTDSKTKETVGNILGLGAAFNTLAEHLNLVKGVLALITAGLGIEAIASIWAALSTMAGVIMTTVIPALTAMSTAIAVTGIGALLIAVGLVTKYLYDQKKAVDDLNVSGQQKINVDHLSAIASLDAAVAAKTITQARRDDLVAQLGLIDGVQKHTTAVDDNTKAQAGSLPVSASVLAQIKATKGAIEGLPTNKYVMIGVQSDGSTIEKVANVITQKFPDERITTITNIVNGQALLDTKKKIEEVIPPEKKMEIQASVDIAKLKAQADVVQSTIEWKAKVDISQIEAASKIITDTFASINNTITSTGTALTSMYGDYATYLTNTSGAGSSYLETQMEQENKRRDAALLLQKELTEAEIEQIKAQTNLLNSGESLIKIEASGLEPHLEAFMFEILKSIQIKANSEGQKFLVGV